MHFRKLDLNQLVCLDTLLTEQSVSRAADKLCVGQSTMSAALGRLREYFGDPLLVQVGRQMRLTDFAQQLASPSRDVMMRIQTLVSSRPQLDLLQVSRRLRVVASDFVASVLMPQVLKRTAQEAPGIQIEILPTVGPRFLDQLEAGEIDVLIIPRPYASENHPLEVLFEETYCCVVDPETGIEEVTFDEYLGMRHVATAPFMYEVEQLSYEEHHLRRLGHKRHLDVTAPYFTLVPELILGTRRIATVHRRLAQQYVRRWGLRMLRCPFEIPPLVECLQYPPHLESDHVVSWFREVLRVEAGRV
jgi:LysR family transcriptional regulator, nod-box dependent transcriptional activator